MAQALYRKYRSTGLSEIVGQEHITQALETAIKQGRLSHAYLFTGPRGTGKTSIARILAHAINDLPYSTNPHLDIIEIDAASNRRIDEIRDLRDKVYIAPSSAKYKVYIIDEVHMLTREAFNALLKTLEEPPQHVVFILATTDAHKLPETIISRTQRYTFRPVEQGKVVAHLKHIATSEGITIDDDAIALLAQHGEGSFRDSISMLDQVGASGQKITLIDVQRQLGLPPRDALAGLVANLAGGSIVTLITDLQTLYDGGYRAPAIAQQLSVLLREQLISTSTSLSAANALQLLDKLQNVAGAHDPERYLEIIIMEVVTPADVAAPVAVTAPAPAASTAPKSKPAVPPAAAQAEKPAIAPLVIKQPEQTPVALVEPEPEPTPTATKSVPLGQEIAMNDESWTAVLTELKKQYNTVYGIVRMAQTDFSDPGFVKLSFSFAFHQKRINDAKNRKIITDLIEECTGQQINLVCSLSSEPRTGVVPVAVSTTATEGDKLQDVASVFGGGELL